MVGCVELVYVWCGFREPVGEMQMKLDWVLFLANLSTSKEDWYQGNVRFSS